MSILDFFGHLANFVAPALTLACVLWLATRLVRSARPAHVASLTSLLLLSGAGVLVLLAGLVVFGRDGKMITYAGLVLVQGTLAWWMRGR